MEPIKDIDDPRIVRFLVAWHENGRARFIRWYPKLNYDSTPYQKVAKARRLYIALDTGTSGHFLVEKDTGHVWGIKAYGVPHHGHSYGPIEEFTRQIEVATAEGREVCGC